MHKGQIFLPSCSGWVSPPLKLHSFLSKTTIHRSLTPLGPNHLTPLGSNQPTTTWSQSPHHPYVLTNPPPLTSITPPSLLTNSCTTPRPQPPYHPPHFSPTNHHPPPTTPDPNHPPPVGPNLPTTPDPNHPTTPRHQPITSWSQSP